MLSCYSHVRWWAKYIFILALFSLIISPILALKEHKRDVIKNTNKRLTKENIGLLGEYHTTISEEGVHATLFPNEPKKEKNIANKWEDIDYYSKEENLFFIYVDSINFVYTIKVGEKAEEVNQFLNKKLPYKKK